MINDIKKQKAITLIALVITIIVLLILASISIAMLKGDNGIIAKANRAKEESKIEQYKEEVNLIIIDEVAERKIKYKEEAFIESLEAKIQEKEWVKETQKSNQDGIEETENKKNTQLLVKTKDGYEILIKVDNTELVAEIVEIRKVGENQEETEESINANISITNNKFTEGTIINLNVTALRRIQKVELRVGDIILYSNDKINSNTYLKDIGLEDVSNLDRISFYDDMTVIFEVTSITGLKKQTTISNVKNYTISTVEQLNKLADVVNSGNSLQNETIIQLSDIDVNPGKWAENADGTVTFKNGATQWKVIGSADYDYDSNNLTNIKAFAGTFDGKYNKIEGVYINNREKDEMGLFAINEGTIKNVILKNSTINGRYNIGGIASGLNNSSAVIYNCKNYASVSGNRSVGGICGWSSGTLKDNTNYGQVSNIIASN